MKRVKVHHSTTRRTAIGIFTAGVISLLAACSSVDSESRELTSKEADLFAQVRFRVYGSEVVNFDITGPAKDHEKISATLSIYTQLYRGYGKLRIGRAEQYIAWNKGSVFVCQDTSNISLPASWLGGPLAEDPIQRLLLILLEMSQPQPDNAQLLRQSDARWLRKEDIGGIECQVFSGPSAAGVSAPASSGRSSPVTEYAVDRDAQLRRFRVRIMGSTGYGWWTATRTSTSPSAALPESLWTAFDEAVDAAGS